MKPKWYLRFVGLCAFLSLLACSTPAAIVVEGNGGCHPASDLPAHMTMQKVPEADTGATQLYELLLDERASHHKDQNRYNSLYGACVK
jgi:hypothetical protein